jgi:hypothetical protein
MLYTCTSIRFTLRPLAPALDHLEPLFLADLRAKLAVLEVLRSLNYLSQLFVFSLHRKTARIM